MSNRSVSVVVSLVAATACGGSVRSVGKQSSAIEEVPVSCDGAIGEGCNDDNLICSLQNQCVAPSYTSNSNGTVTDDNTGLIWQEKVPANPCPHSGTTGQCLWDEAKTYCKKLKLGGSSAWRLPTLQEMFSLVDMTGSKPTIDKTAFPHTPFEVSAYWTTTCREQDAGTCDLVATVSFYDALSGSSSQEYTSYVRCVH